MIHLIERVLYATPGWRAALVFVFCCLLMAMLALGHLRPERIAVNAASRLWQQLEAQRHYQQQFLAELPTLSSLPDLPAPRPAFSVLEFVKSSGGELMLWSPGPDGRAELHLSLMWRDIPDLFPRLMEYAVHLQGFSLAPGISHLLLTLHIEEVES